MTNREGRKLFLNGLTLTQYKKQAYLNKGGFLDKPMLSLEWSYFVDDLCKSGVITLNQFAKWSL